MSNADAGPGTTVSVVIPTIGRASLDDAIKSVLSQSTSVFEIIVVADTAEPIDPPADDRIRMIRVGPHAGSSNARQAGIDAARGDVIALLDDDDLWHPYKLERQLAALPPDAGEYWISACRCAVRGGGRAERVWPRTLIGAHQPVAEYLFRMSGLTFGNGMLQTSTLCFPRSLAIRMPLNREPESIHDEPGWLMAVQDKLPNVTFSQVEDCFAIYNVSDNSLSRQTADMSDRYIDWGRANLGAVSARVRGDYYLTSPVTAAAEANSVRGIRNSVVAAFAEGRPGFTALLYASAKFAVVGLRRLKRPDVRAS